MSCDWLWQTGLCVRLFYYCVALLQKEPEGCTSVYLPQVWLEMFGKGWTWCAFLHLVPRAVHYHEGWRFTGGIFVLLHRFIFHCPSLQQKRKLFQSHLAFQVRFCCCQWRTKIQFGASALFSQKCTRVQGKSMQTRTHDKGAASGDNNETAGCLTERSRTTHLEEDEGTYNLVSTTLSVHLRREVSGESWGSGHQVTKSPKAPKEASPTPDSAITEYNSLCSVSSLLEIEEHMACHNSFVHFHCRLKPKDETMFCISVGWKK